MHAYSCRSVRIHYAALPSKQPYVRVSAYIVTATCGGMHAYELGNTTQIYIYIYEN